MFKVNDAVFYGVHGVCTVSDISKREFCGTVSDYYTLKPVYSHRSTVFVPVSKAGTAAKMRKVLSKEEVYEVIGSLPMCESVWVDDDSARKEKYAGILKNGSANQLAGLIKTLYDQKKELALKNKKMHAADERTLAEAEKMLNEEFAYALDIDKESVIPFISEQLGKLEEETVR